MNMAANDDDSNQYTLVTHLYQIFGSLLGCSMQNESSPFKNYQGNPSMSDVHRFMNLNASQLGYFIQEVGRSATSFGVSDEDAMTVGMALNTTFGYRCSPPTALAPGAGNYSQSTCLAADCPIDPNRNCTMGVMSYPNGTENVMPEAANDMNMSDGSDDDSDNDDDSSSGGSNGGSSGGSSGTGGGSNNGDGRVVNIVGALALAAAAVAAVGL